MLRMLSLFSGIGAIDLAAEWTGRIKTVGFCEIDPYCQKVLNKHWPDVPVHNDICRLGGDKVGTVEIVAGGFPCQDLSVAGKKAGLVDSDGEATRSGLWFEMLRVIQETKPLWVVGENVAGMLSHDQGRTFAEIIGGLEGSGYEVLPIVSSACNYGAAFEGKRVFIIAASKSSGHGRSAGQKLRAITGKLVTEECQRDKAWGETERRIVEIIRTQKAIPDDIRSDYGLADWVDTVRGACEMKAITILQPWASLIACGAKQIETRSWPTNYRGPIAIHAGKALPSNDRQIIADTLYEKQQFHLPLGKVIAIADLIDCVKVIGFDEFANSPILDRKEWLLQDSKESAFGDYTIGRYAWILENVRPIDPVPARGQQRIWKWESADNGR